MTNTAKVKDIYIAKDIEADGKVRYAMGYNKRDNGMIDFETASRNEIKFWRNRESIIKRVKIDYKHFGYTDFNFIDIEY